MNTLKRAAALVFAIVAGLAVSACGSDGKDANQATTTSGSNYAVVSDARVTEGLGRVRAFAASIRAQAPTDLVAAEATFTELHDEWFEFEGTIRSKEKSMYLDIEDALGGIKLGVQENKLDRVISGVAALNAAIDVYLSAHP